MTNKVEVRELRKLFGDNEVLKSINLDVKEGEVVCIIGPSGSGKSTLLRCLNRLEEIQGGTIVVNGKKISEAKDIDNIRQTIGMVFQHFNLRSEEHTSELQSRFDLVCRLLLEKKK